MTEMQYRFAKHTLIKEKQPVETRVLTYRGKSYEAKVSVRRVESSQQQGQTSAS